MKKPIVVTGLDLGSSKIAAVTAEIDRERGLRMLARATEPSRGVSSGAVVDLNECANVVSKVLGKVRRKARGGHSGIYVNISGETIEGSRSRGMIPISLRGREVTRSDMDRCVEAASTIRLPFDREIIHKIVQNFSVDDVRCVDNPSGLYASRLNCEVFVVTAGANYIQNIHKCLNSAGYDVKEVVFTGIADGAAFLDAGEKKERETRMLINIGASLTEISIFSGSALRDLGVVRTGAGDIKDDFKNSAEFAGIVSSISAKVREVLDAGGTIGSVILTGGIVFADGVVECLEERLSYPVKVGVVKDVKGDVSSLDSVRFATAIGLCKHARNRYEEKIRKGRMTSRLASRLVDIFNNYF